MDITVVVTQSDFESLKPGWNKLLNEKCTLFQSWDFNYTWYLNNPDIIKQLYIVYYYKNDSIEFILPTYINFKKQLCFLQSGASDFLNVLYQDEDKIGDFLSDCFSHILSDKSIRTINLMNIKHDSPLLGYLPFILKKQYFFIFQNTIFSKLPYLGYNPEYFHEKLNTKYRRKKIRKLDKLLPSNLKIINSIDSPFPQDKIVSLLNIMEEQSLRKKSNFDGILRFQKRLFELNLLNYAAQELDGNIISLTSFIYLNDREILPWIDLYDPRIKNVNLKLQFLLINEFIKNGVSVNFGTGIYDFKIVNFNPEQYPLFQLFATASKWQFIMFWIKKLGAKLLRLI